MGLLFYSGKGIRNIQRTSGTGVQGTSDVYTIFYTDDSVSAYSVVNGKDGASPFIGANGNWWVGTVDLGVKASATPDLSAYATKVQSDSYYLGINSQAIDSAKLGGHLPSYFQSALGFTPENQSNKVTSFAASTDTQYPSALLVSNQLANKLNTSLKGVPNGLAELGADGFVLNTQLPAYVDKIINVTTYSSLPITGVSSAIYIADDTNITYRWGGSSYVEISSSLALGETPATAYRGDRGAVSYAHSQLITGNPHRTTKSDIGLSLVPNILFSGSNTGDQDLSGLVPKTYMVNGHVLSGNVAVTQADLGLVIGTNVLGYRTFGSAANNNTGDFAPSSNVSFPGFGATHVLAAYGDHLHTGIYEVPLIFSTGLTRTGNTITNNVSQYTDTMADARVVAGITGKQASLNGLGLVRMNGATLSYDNATYLTSFSETDPIFTAWNKSTGISITKSQITDFPTSMPANGGISSQVTISYNQASNSNYQLLWGNGNFIYGNSNIFCNPYTGIITATGLQVNGAANVSGSVTSTGLQVNGNANVTGSLNGTSAAFSSMPTVGGTSLNSAFIQNNPTFAQSGSVWVDGDISYAGNIRCDKAGNGIFLSRVNIGYRSALTTDTSGNLLLANSSDWTNLLVNKSTTFNSTVNLTDAITVSTFKDIYFGLRVGNGIGQYYDGTNLILYNGTGGENLFTLNRINGAATFSSTVQATQFNRADGATMWHSGNFNAAIYQLASSSINTGNIASQSVNNSKTVDFLSGRVDSTTYQILWGAPQGLNPNTGNNTTSAFSCAAVTITSSTGTVNATNFGASGYINAAGNISATSFSSSGTITATGLITGSDFKNGSDIRLKTNLGIIPLTGDQFNFVKYELKTELGRARYGVIANQLQLTHPELVGKRDDGMLTVSYIDLLVIKAATTDQKIKALQQQVLDLQIKVNNYERSSK